MFNSRILTGFLLLCFYSALYAQNPEAASGWKIKPLVYGAHGMVVTNNPFASRAAFQILKQGGNAVDAAVAAAFVLGLTEPQSSGIGGGGYALIYHYANHQLTVYNGREKAPLSANPGLFLDQHHQLIPLNRAMLSPQSIGVPGEVALLHTMQSHAGRLPWAQLIKPAITLANKGFPLSPRLYGLLKKDEAILIKNPAIKEIFFKNNQVKSPGNLIKNPAYASSLSSIAINPNVFYSGKLAQDICSTVNELAGKTLLSLNDFRGYQVRVEESLCAPWRAYTICTSGAESGGATLLELMGIYAHNYAGKFVNDTEWMYQFLEASKLAFADRNKYSADPSFTDPVSKQRIAETYIQQQAKRVGQFALKMPVDAGVIKKKKVNYGSDQSIKVPGTTSIAIVDAEGNAISMTLSIEQQFGSHVFVDGFFLNNELTDFSFKSADEQGNPIANSPQAQKRPRSAMSPTMVFNKKKQLIALSGSPGGSDIICFIAKNLIFMLDFKKDAQASVASGNLCSNNTFTVIEANSSLTSAIRALEQRGELIKTGEMVSGITNIQASSSKGWFGAADPRREGVAIGED